MCDISIIIVSWNTKKLLQQCLHSIYDTTHDVTFEVFVIDNNSSDGSQEMVKEQFPDSRLIVVAPNDKLRRGYERTVERERLKDVVFTGYVPNDNLPSYYRTADIFCAPAFPAAHSAIPLCQNREVTPLNWAVQIFQAASAAPPERMAPAYSIQASVFIFASPAIDAAESSIK